MEGPWLKEGYREHHLLGKAGMGIIFQNFGFFSHIFCETFSFPFLKTSYVSAKSNSVLSEVMLLILWSR